MVHQDLGPSGSCQGEKGYDHVRIELLPRADLRPHALAPGARSKRTHPSSPRHHATVAEEHMVVLNTFASLSPQQMRWSQVFCRV